MKSSFNGILWRGERNAPIAEIISDAIRMYVAKYGVSPIAVFVSVEDYSESLVVEGMTIRPLRTVPKRHCWLGRDDEVKITHEETYTLVGSEDEA